MWPRPEGGLGIAWLDGRNTAGAQHGGHGGAQGDQDADARVAIPLRSGLRSLNIAVAGGILVAEALRQLDAFPPLGPMPEAETGER